MNAIRNLKESVSDGYNLAMEVPINYKITDENLLPDFERNGCPVLAQATGCLGVLRAMDLPGRRPGIQARMAAEGGSHMLLHLVFIHDNKFLTASIHSYIFTINKEE